MCRNCVLNAFPQRDRYCTENGVYVLNFSGCTQCKSDNRAPDALKVTEKTKTEEVEEEGITKEILKFKHSCVKCGHVVGEHNHEFWIEDGYQEYRMECLICGLGEDSMSVLPKDPRKISQALF